MMTLTPATVACVTTAFHRITPEEFERQSNLAKADADKWRNELKADHRLHLLPGHPVEVTNAHHSADYVQAECPRYGELYIERRHLNLEH